MGSESVSWLIDAVLNDLAKVLVVEPSLRIPFQTVEGPVLRVCRLELAAFLLDYLSEELGRHLVKIFELREICAYHALHPIAVCCA